MVVNVTECARSALMLTENYPNTLFVGILPMVAQGCTTSPNILRYVLMT